MSKLVCYFSFVFYDIKLHNHKSCENGTWNGFFTII